MEVSRGSANEVRSGVDWAPVRPQRCSVRAGVIGVACPGGRGSLRRTVGARPSVGKGGSVDEREGMGGTDD